MNFLSFIPLTPCPHWLHFLKGSIVLKVFLDLVKKFCANNILNVCYCIGSLIYIFKYAIIYVNGYDS